MEYAFHVFNRFVADGICMATDKLLKDNLADKLAPAPFLCKNSTASRQENKRFQQAFDGDFSSPPVVVCVGSDLAIGDSLGPLVGSMLSFKTQGLPVFIYGTLSAPVTAKEISSIRRFLKSTHPSSQIVAVDAAVGMQGDVGLIKVLPTPLCPGAGANKALGDLGDISIMGIVAEKSVANYGFLNTTRLHLVYAMAERIADGLSNLLWERGDKSRAKALDRREDGVL